MCSFTTLKEKKEVQWNLSSHNSHIPEFNTSWINTIKIMVKRKTGLKKLYIFFLDNCHYLDTSLWPSIQKWNCYSMSFTFTRSNISKSSVTKTQNYHCWFSQCYFLLLISNEFFQLKNSLMVIVTCYIFFHCGAELVVVCGCSCQQSGLLIQILSWLSSSIVKTPSTAASQ